MNSQKLSLHSQSIAHTKDPIGREVSLSGIIGENGFLFLKKDIESRHCFVWKYGSRNSS